MVSNPHGSGIYRLRRTASVESYRWRRRGDLAYRLVRCRTRHSCHLFRLPSENTAAFVGSAQSLKNPLRTGRSAVLACHAPSYNLPRLLRRLNCDAGTMSPPILCVEFLQRGVPRLLITYEKSFYTQNATGKRIAR